jgi:hypothetical protein
MNKRKNIVIFIALLLTLSIQAVIVYTGFQLIQNVPTLTSSSPPQANPTSTVATAPNVPSAEPAVGNCNPNNTTYRSASRAYVSAETQVKQSNRIFLGQVSKIGNLVWNSPDGTAPNLNNPNVNAPDYEQFAPVEYRVVEAYLGNLKPGDKVTLLQSGAPCAKPYNYPSIKFPLLGEKRVLMLFPNDQDFRRSKGITPLTSPVGYNLILQTDETWRDIEVVTIDQIKDFVKNLPADHTPVPFNYVSPPKSTTPTLPTVTPTSIASGQLINLVRGLELNKTQMIRVTNGVTVGRVIVDDQIIKQVVATLDKPLPYLDKVEAGRLLKPREPAAWFWFEWVENGLHSTIQLHYYFDSKILSVQNEEIQVVISLDLDNILGSPLTP